MDLAEITFGEGTMPRLMTVANRTNDRPLLTSAKGGGGLSSSLSH